MVGMVGVLVGLNFPFIICNKGVVMKYLSIILIACLGLNLAGCGEEEKSNGSATPEEIEKRSKETTDAYIEYGKKSQHFSFCQLQANEIPECKDFRELKEKCATEAKKNIPDCKYIMKYIKNQH